MFIRDGEVCFFATKHPCNNLASGPAHLQCRWSPNRVRNAKKREVSTFGSKNISTVFADAARERHVNTV